jgi:hypothetical protein
VSNACPRAGALAPYIDPDEVLAGAIELFARVPGLLEKLLERSRLNVANNKPHSFFNDLFVGASRPAVGANYNVVGYRLRDMDEICSTHGAADGDFTNLDGHVASPRFEVTPKMIEAGVGVLEQLEGVPTLQSDLVSEVFRAMVRTRALKEHPIDASAECDDTGDAS